MKKKILSVFISLLVIVLLILTMSVVFAAKPIPVSGTIILTSYTMLNAKPSGNSDNVILTMGLTEEWHGDIEASGTTVATWIVKNKPLMTNPDAWLNVHEKLTFQTFTVTGLSGTVTMQLVISKTKGSWTILSGTGELANIRGQGKISMETTPYTYTGQIHFDPN